VRSNGRKGSARRDVDDASIEPSSVRQKDQKRQNAHLRATRKLRLFTETNLDGRSSASRNFNAIVANVSSDLGGRDALTEIEKHLITSFAGAAILQGHQLAKLLSGEEIDPDEYSSITTSMIRSAMRLGIGRRQKDVTPSLSEYIASKFSDEDVEV
jgi:hypothetical protein